MKLFELINVVKGEIGKIQKSGYNPHFKNNYMTLESISQELEPVLHKNGLIVLQYVDGLRLVMEVRVSGTEEKIVTEMPLIGATNMQQLGAAITYARRYQIVAFFGILDKDDDGNDASGIVVPKPIQNTPTSQPSAPQSTFQL